MRLRALLVQIAVFGYPVGRACLSPWDRLCQGITTPVTAELLQKLHETLGDEATTDLFAWWEEAATVNRTAIREVADLYFDRFRTLIDKSLAEVRAGMDKRSAELRGEIAKGLTEVRAEFRTERANQRADLIKWMFTFWVGTVVPLAGLIVALDRL